MEDVLVEVLLVEADCRNEWQNQAESGQILLSLLEQYLHVSRINLHVRKADIELLEANLLLQFVSKEANQ